jgi:hypothetical protein
MADFTLSTSLSDPAGTLTVLLDDQIVLSGSGFYSQPLISGHKYVVQFYVQAPDDGADYTVAVTSPINRHISVHLNSREKDFGGFRFTAP